MYQPYLPVRLATIDVSAEYSAQQRLYAPPAFAGCGLSGIFCFVTIFAFTKTAPSLRGAPRRIEPPPLCTM